jgi:uncharacterized protein (DUF1778 family)
LLFLVFVRTFLGMKTRMGRPPKNGGKAMAGRLEIRVSEAEKLAYEEAAQATGVDRSDWIRSTLNEAARRVLRKKPS